MILRPFFSYYGAKWRAIKHYPEPAYQQIIEPFAGSACYSLYYSDRNVYLVDIDPVIVGVWEYLIAASESEIMSLPTDFEHISELTTCPKEARDLIGFWLNKGMTAPCLTPSKWMRNPLPGRLQTYWGEGIKNRIASQLKYIRHWRVECKSYKLIDNHTATYFVDPPYNNRVGRRYRYHAINYNHLAQWCRSRHGHIITCEQKGADWLPFWSLAKVKAAKAKYSEEMVWLN